ncbi:PHA/PHB synthase family protein [Burkholderia guangdongensis]|uniref:PHA/PHB synthase family protein n=1 Tax=Burkholderia guangdongensis TaxID=1792500 RepID=UPI0015CA0A04|nr:alpha/beta fold hydrolase [Burkholderia guangdongensis]
MQQTTPAARECRECDKRRPMPAGDAWDRAAHATVAAATMGMSPASLAIAWFDWATHLAVSPGKCVDLAMQAGQAALTGFRPAPAPAAHRREIGETGETGGSDAPALAAAPPFDPRFVGNAWSRWPFSVYRDAFLSIEQWWQQATTGVPGVDRHHEDLVRFFARQCIDACSPGNFVATNPVVLDAALESGGRNFVDGARHWREDVDAMLAHLRGQPFRPAAGFRPGRELAVTPGRVVFRNAMFELLQYMPKTQRVAREPILLVPSWIMKYYILDLQPHNSLIRYLVDEGFTVFAISWRNPGEEARDVGLDDYLRDGLLAALNEVRARCGDAVHAVGYCLGGTLLAIGAAALARDGHADALRTMTLLAALTDFSDPGELGLFIDASELAALDALMWRQGYLDGAQMRAAFQLLNARDLVWSRMMSEYLLGRRLKPNDLTAWNADTTRMPYRMHSEYLTHLFLDNDLAEGRYCVDGRPVALGDIETPTFVVGTERDHVSPWKSVYRLHLLTHHALTFVLTAGGHNAGIVSEPGHPKRHYRSATREADTPYRGDQAFFDDTPVVAGSWWPCWSGWLERHSTGEVAARDVPDGLADAPGTYVHES